MCEALRACRSQQNGAVATGHDQFHHMSRSANTQAQSVNVIHSDMSQGEGVAHARGRLRPEAV